LHAAEAAVELLTGHERWLHRNDFVEAWVETAPALSGEPMAGADWQAAVTALAAGRLPCAASEAQVLPIAASLAEGVPLDLPACLSGLDEVNVILVAAALLHASGRRDGTVASVGMAGW
jgi:hypothetical protein